MLKEMLGESKDIFSAIGAITTGIVAFKITLGLFRFCNVFFLSRALGLHSNLKNAGSWAVVTGCTDGIGKAYAEQLAKKGLNVVLMSRTLSKLTDMAKEIESKFKVQTRVIAADFSREDIYDNIRSELSGLDIGVLVNNVGTSYDHPEFFAEVDTPDFINTMIHMNCTSVAKMTEIVLPEMTKKRKGYIINIGSSAATQPTPFLALYSATKAYVDFLSRSLQLEYQSKGITIQNIAPYFIVSKLSKFRKPTLFVPTPDTFVKSALATVGLETVTTGYWPHRVMAFYMQFLPYFLTNNFMLDARKRALKKKAQAKQKE